MIYRFVLTSCHKMSESLNDSHSISRPIIPHFSSHVIDKVFISVYDYMPLQNDSKATILVTHVPTIFLLVSHKNYPLITFTTRMYSHWLSMGRGGGAERERVFEKIAPLPLLHVLNSELNTFVV